MPLEAEILPLLRATELGRLACTCKELCATVTAADARIWHKAALEILHPKLPALRACQDGASFHTPALRAALQQSSRIHTALQKGQYNMGERITAVAHEQKLCVDRVHS